MKITGHIADRAGQRQRHRQRVQGLFSGACRRHRTRVRRRRPRRRRPGLPPAASGFARYRDDDPRRAPASWRPSPSASKGWATPSSSAPWPDGPAAGAAGGASRRGWAVGCSPGLCGPGTGIGGDIRYALAGSHAAAAPDPRRRSVPRRAGGRLRRQRISLAFSVAGGDTASALRGRLPGGRQGTPRASRHFRELVGRVIQAAVAEYEAAGGNVLAALWRRQ
ncbi:hypothetical protein ACU4GD_18160 [Cupriavidus basilensis]